MGKREEGGRKGGKEGGYTSYLLFLTLLSSLKKQKEGAKKSPPFVKRKTREPNQTNKEERKETGGKREQ